jgi:hypothetical protein
LRLYRSTNSKSAIPANSVIIIGESGTADCRSHSLSPHDLKRGTIEVAVLEWSDRDKQIITVDWTRVSDAAGAAEFAAKVRASKRSSNGLTAIGDALLAAQAVLARAPAPADRRGVDVSGDGMANIGLPVDEARDTLIASGITINGLAILASKPWLSDYYNQYVIGGPERSCSRSTASLPSPRRCKTS